MGGRGASIGSAAKSRVANKFEYRRSPDLKDWSDAEEKRAKEHSKKLMDLLKKGGWEEYYEENAVDTVERIPLNAHGYARDDEIEVVKMNLVYTQNWDENDRRVKRGKAVTGTTYYVVYDGNGVIDENYVGYKTKADAIHAAKLHVDRMEQYYKFKADQEKKKK